MLFVKYVSDKYADDPYAPITVPKGAGFSDMVRLKGKPTIGDDINKRILGPIGEANKISDFPDFNDVNRLGSGKEMVTRLTNLIAIFENPGLDFSKNRVEGDDLLGDAYEYLMRNFATESGKSKGQFYTPAEVSRIMAKIIGIDSKRTSSDTTVYDPTCGSGSLLLKVGAESDKQISLFGQEMDVATASLARMNMILHNNPTADIKQGNTLANPRFLDNAGKLKTFDFAVANPPFSFKSWGNGVDPVNDIYRRFQDFGIPPSKNGDYAFLLHLIRSLKSKGKGAIILPHGVLFRGGSEAEIRKNLIDRGYIKGIIGLPPNLFYGTGIPACIIVIDKENAGTRKGIFMIDASKGFVKDGNKNRLREQDIHRIVDIFNRQETVPKYSRLVPVEEISGEKNEYNLNIPRYIDSQEAEDIQDIEAHLNGGIPDFDIEALNPYWEVYPSLRKVLFSDRNRKGYSYLNVQDEEIREAIFSHSEFSNYNRKVNKAFDRWKEKNIPVLSALDSGTKPKILIRDLSEDLLKHFEDLKLIDKYDIYQHLMAYWNEIMHDDVSVIAEDGWESGNEIEWGKKEREFEGRIIPKKIMIARYFENEQKEIDRLQAHYDEIQQQLKDLEEEHNTEEGYFSEFVKINKTTVQRRLKVITESISGHTILAAEPKTDYRIQDDQEDEEISVLQQYLNLVDEQADYKKAISEMETGLNNDIIRKYDELSVNEIKDLMINNKWIETFHRKILEEMQLISHKLTHRIAELSDRYNKTLPSHLHELSILEEKVKTHIVKMGFTC